MKRLLSITAVAAGISLGTLAPAQAAGFTLDFDTDANGNPLNANQLDGAGSNGFSTTADNIGDLWSSLGITITDNKSAPLGLFNSNCLPKGGVSNDGFTAPCNTSRRNGDPDLATGNGAYKGVTYNTAPQGNVLILEENAGNGTPDDIASGGTIRFSFNRALLSSVKLDQIGIIDDARGKIRVNFLDGTKLVQTITNREENELQFFNINADKQVKDFEVSFKGSGAISGVAFSELKSVEPVPEPMTILGSVVAVGMGAGLKRLRKR